MLGAIPGLENLKSKLSEVSKLVDGIILSSGQVDRLADILKGKLSPSLIIRSDWTNAYRGEDYVLPATELKYTLIVNPEDALKLGADALAAYYIVGYDKDEEEPFNMKCLSSLARSSNEYGLPLLVQVLPVGSRVTKENYEDCVKLGVRQAVEVGGDIIAAPIIGGKDQINQLAELAKTPFMALEDFSTIKESALLARDIVNANASGLILGKKSFQLSGFNKVLDNIYSIIHGGC